MYVEWQTIWFEMKYEFTRKLSCCGFVTGYCCKNKNKHFTQCHRRTGRGSGRAAAPQSGKTGDNVGRSSGNFVPLDIDLHEVTKSAYRFATLRFGPMQHRCAANVKLRCNVYRPTERSRADVAANAMQSSMIWLLKKTTSD